MAKYIIVAKGSSDVNGGNGQHYGGVPITQTESATELIINRLACIDLIKRGLVTKDTIVLTLEERKFLYENLVDTVETYNPNNIYEDCIDLVTDEMLNRLAKTLPYKPFYTHFERDKKEILDIPYNEDILNRELSDFLICIPRLKNSDTRRNIDKNYWREFLEHASKKYERVFVFGKGNADLDKDNIEYIDTLQDYCSYLHHKSCKHLVSTISGPCHYAQEFGNPDLKVTMIDNLGLIEKHGHDPSYFHPCINFTGVEVRFIKELIEPKDLIGIC